MLGTYITVIHLPTEFKERMCACMREREREGEREREKERERCIYTYVNVETRKHNVFLLLFTEPSNCSSLAMID